MKLLTLLITYSPKNPWKFIQMAEQKVYFGAHVNVYLMKFVHQIVNKFHKNMYFLVT